MEDNLIEKKRAQRKALLRSLYEAVGGVGFAEACSHSPTLAHQKAVQTKDGLPHVVEKIMEAFN